MADLPSIEQTLHGYNHGHRLLIQSGGLNERELALLDRLSDLSGYLPPKTEFNYYYTGFPCGRFYAFACTWPDKTAKRAGTVLTHTLLVPLPFAATLPALGMLLMLVRRPASSEDRKPYEMPVQWPAPTARHELVVSSRDELHALLALYFGMPQRPILWQDEQSAWTAVQTLWRYLWPEARREFSFCTFALQVRFLASTPFDLLGLPDTARGSFHEVSASPSWYVHGTLPHGRAIGLLEEPWLAELVSEGPGFTDRHIGFARSYSLSVLPADLPLLWRCQGLLAEAPKRLSAARAFSDLLHARFSALPFDHPLWREATEHRLRLQDEAPLVPRPLWELCDYLGSPQVQARAQAEPEYAARAETMLVTQLTLRLQRAPDASIAALPELRQTLQRSEWRQAVYLAAERVVRDAESEHDGLVRARVLGQQAAAHGDLALAVAALRPLSAAQRIEVARAMSDERGGLGAFLREVAQQLTDPLLAFEGFVLSGQTDQGLLYLSRANEVDPIRRLEILERAIEQLSLSARLDWALRCDGDTEVMRFAVQVGSDAADQMTLPLRELGERVISAISAHSVAIFLRQAERTGPLARQEVLRGLPELTLACVLLILQDPRRGNYVAAEAIRELPGTHLLDPRLRATVKSSPPSSHRTDVMNRVGRHLLLAICTGQLSEQETVAWLRSEPIQTRFDQETYSSWWFYGAFSGGRPAAEHLPTLAEALVRALTGPPPLGVQWLGKLLDLPLKAASRTSLEHAARPLSRLFDLPLPPETRKELAVHVLEATRQHRPPSGYLLIERSFALVHAGVDTKKDTLVQRLLSMFAVDGWDRAKAWRHFLLDIWIENDWPRVSFLRALDDDDGTLFRRIAKRANKSEQGRRFLQQIVSTVEADTTLRARWYKLALKVVEGHDSIDHD